MGLKFDKGMGWEIGLGNWLGLLMESNKEEKRFIKYDVGVVGDNVESVEWWLGV